MTEHTCTIAHADAAIIDSDIIDLNGCSVLQISIGLNEYDLNEPGLSQWLHTWPDVVQRIVMQEVEKWKAAHSTARVQCVSSALRKRDAKAGHACLILHYEERGT